jgi:hypothetical protein
MTRRRSAMEGTIGDGRELSLDRGCPLCGGALAIRLTHGSTWSYCDHCKWLSRPRIGFTEGGLQMMHPVAAA